MHFTAIIVSATAIVTGVTSAATGVTRYGTLRLYGKPSCDQTLNLGELGVYNDAINKCNVFPGDDTIRSLKLEYNPYGCTLEVYNDVTCHLNRHDVTLGQCLSGDKSYGSYKLVCST